MCVLHRRREAAGPPSPAMRRVQDPDLNSDSQLSQGAGPPLGGPGAGAGTRQESASAKQQRRPQRRPTDGDENTATLPSQGEEERDAALAHEDGHSAAEVFGEEGGQSFSQASITRLTNLVGEGVQDFDQLMSGIEESRALAGQGGPEADTLNVLGLAAGPGPDLGAAPSRARPRVGAGVLLTHPRKPGCVLVGRRRGAHGAGTLQLPGALPSPCPAFLMPRPLTAHAGLAGGHVEYGESWAACARKEVYEETGLYVRHLRFLTCTNDVFEDEGRHYVTLFLAGECDAGEEARRMEPEKCDSWEWMPWADLHRHREMLFLPLLNLVVRLRFAPFDAEGRLRAFPPPPLPPLPRSEPRGEYDADGVAEGGGMSAFLAGPDAHEGDRGDPTAALGEPPQDPSYLDASGLSWHPSHPRVSRAVEEARAAARAGEHGSSSFAALREEAVAAGVGSVAPRDYAAAPPPWRSRGADGPSPPVSVPQPPQLPPDVADPSYGADAEGGEEAAPHLSKSRRLVRTDSAREGSQGDRIPAPHSQDSLGPSLGLSQEDLSQEFER